MPVDIVKLLPTGALLVLTSSVCLAGVNESISDCESSESKDGRIACLENALRQLADADGSAHASADMLNVRKPQAPEPDNTPVSVAEPAQPPVEPATITKAPSLPVSQPEAAAPATGDAAIAELGAEQVEARKRSNSEDEATVSATVVDFDFVGYQRLLVQLDNGQIWRQIEGDRTSVERGLRGEEKFDVELWGTAFGGYRMRIAQLDRTIRVERLK